MTEATENKEVAIIGFGTAGMNAAIGLRTGGYGGTIRVFSDHGTLPYSPILTSYYAGLDKGYDQCFPWSADEVADLDLEVMQNSPVIGLDVDAHIIKTRNGDYPYAKCVIATGATPQTVGFPQDCGYKPLVLRTMDDAERLKACLDSEGCNRVLVSGASMVALKMLEAILHHGCAATLVGISNHVLDYNALPETAERFERGLEAKGVKLRLGQTIKDVEVMADGESPLGRRLQVTFSNGDVEEFDEIAVAHGMRCNLGFLEPGSIEVDRGVIVDEFMRTSNPDVYAAGDIAQATELITGEKRIVGIWKTAALQGQCCGRSIASELAGTKPDAAIAYKGYFPTNTIAVDGTLFISAGEIMPSSSRTIEIVETGDMTVAYTYEDGGDNGRRLIGFNLACDKDEAGSAAYDLGAMSTLRIERECRSR